GPDHTPLLALPGNPVSSYVSFELFVRPAIRTLMGLTDVHRPRTRATLTADGPLRSPNGRRQFRRGRYADGAVTPVRGAVSHLVAALARANALIVVPEDTESLEPAPRPRWSCSAEHPGLAVPCRALQAHAPHRDGPGPGSPHDHDRAFPGGHPRTLRAAPSDAHRRGGRRPHGRRPRPGRHRAHRQIGRASCRAQAA